MTILSLGFGIDRIFSCPGNIKLFGRSDDLRADREMLLCSSSWAAFYFRSMTYGQRGCANEDTALIRIIRGGQSFPLPCWPPGIYGF